MELKSNVAVYLDHYCERIAVGLWGEPLNVLSNIGFFIAAYYCWRTYQKEQQETAGHKRDIETLLLLMLAIGVGSSLWHLFATQTTLWADRIPILLFMNIYLLSCLFRGLRCSKVCGIGLFMGYHILNATVLLSLPIELFNRSLFYLPTWAFLGLLCIAVWRQGIDSKRYYLLTWILFSLAILFRSMDMVACDVMPIGTHFVWHILVSLTLYVSMLALLHIDAAQEVSKKVKNS